MPLLSEVNGIDETVEGRLHRIGITSTEALLREGSTRAGILRMGVRSGINKERIQSFLEELASMI